MLPLSLFRIRGVHRAQVSAFAISVSFFAAYLYATLYLQDVLGLSAIDAGLAYLPVTLTIFVVSGATAKLGETDPASGDDRRRTCARRGRHGADDDRRRALELARDPARRPGGGIGTGLFNPAMSYRRARLGARDDEWSRRRASTTRPDKPESRSESPLSAR